MKFDKKYIPTIILAVIVVFMLAYPVISRSKATSDVPDIGTPPEVCANIASKVDNRVEKYVLYRGTFSMDILNPCTQQMESNVQYDVCEGWRICRYLFSDGSMTGKLTQGYMGGETTSFTLCSDGRSEVKIQPFGYWYAPSAKEICSTFE